MLRLLLNRGANVDQSDVAGLTPLHLAARGGHDACIRELLSNGADIAKRSAPSHTSLLEATLGGHLTTAYS